MMSSWLPANLFKSAPAQRSLGRGGGQKLGDRTGGEGRGQGQRGEEQVALLPIPAAALCVLPGQGCPGMPRCSPGTPLCLWQRWHIARPSCSHESCLSSHVIRPVLRLFSAGIYGRYLHLAGSATCLSSNRLLPLPEEMGWERGHVG